jgi:polar amino acid transport system substrate-binding protein
MMARLTSIICAVTIIFAQPALSQVPVSLSVTNMATAPLTTPQRDGYYDLIAIESFKRIGREITIQTVPGERALINLNNGIDDATLVRIEGLEKTFLNLRMVPEKIMDFDFVAFTLDPDIEINDWADLTLYSVAYINGWQMFEQNIKSKNLVTKVNNAPQLFDLLISDRTEVILFGKWMGLSIIRERGLTQMRLLSPPLVTSEMYMYVHEKHNSLIDDLATAIRSMNTEGAFDLIFEQTLAPLLVK